MSERLGHSNISITLNTYSHAIPALQADAAEKVAGLIFDTSAAGIASDGLQNG